MFEITVCAVTQLEGRPQIPLAQQKHRVTGRWSLTQGVQWIHSRCLFNICWDLYSPIGRWETSVLKKKKKSMGWVYSKVAKTRTCSGLFVIQLFLEIPPSTLLDTRVCISQTCSCLKRKHLIPGRCESVEINTSEGTGVGKTPGNNVQERKHIC